MKKEAVKATTSEEIIEAINRGDSVDVMPGTYLIDELSLQSEQTLRGINID